jgi:hypothetical protein
VANFSAAERRELAKRGLAMPDGSFPIRDAGDLANAIKLAGNASNPAAARAFVMKRARALGLKSRIPVTWL